MFAKKTKSSHRKQKPETTPEAVCKTEKCEAEATNDGYCRKHFLSVLSGKAQGNGKPQGKLKSVKKPASKRTRRKKVVEQEEADLQELHFDSNYNNNNVIPFQRVNPMDSSHLDLMGEDEALEITVDDYKKAS